MVTDPNAVSRRLADDPPDPGFSVLLIVCGLLATFLLWRAGQDRVAAIALLSPLSAWIMKRRIAKAVAGKQVMALPNLLEALLPFLAIAAPVILIAAGLTWLAS